MAPYVEAKSLSDITQIAANPPKYPRNPTEQKRASLTLYIARVPGSRDIILTTLTPQLKNVTAADVASSLYYFHLNSADDAKFLEDDQPSSEEETAGSTQKLLPRKPLPESARSSLDMNRQMTSVSLSAGLHPAVPRRKPVTHEIAMPVLPQQPGTGQQSIPRRPLGPRPLISEPAPKGESHPGTENRSLTSDSQSQKRFPGEINGVEAAKDASSSEAAGIETIVDLKSQDSFSITLIRRDPSSGAQWNVGTVSGHPGSQGKDSRRTRTISKGKKPYFDISIQLSTPGYSNFRHPFPTGHEAGSAADVARRSVDISSDQIQASSLSNATFDRQVLMHGMSNFWGRSPMQHQRTRSDLSSSWGESDTTRSKEHVPSFDGGKYDSGNHLSAHGRGSSGSSEHASAGPALNTQGVDPGFIDSQSKGYMFVSPWGGRCKFSTGGGGRSLQCKHTLPSPVSAGNTAAPVSSTQISAPVSELRFNLPSSAVFSSSTADSARKRSSFDSGRATMSKFGNLRKKLSPQKGKPPIPPRPHPTSYAAVYPSDGEEAPPLPPRSNRTTDSSEEETPSPLPTTLRPVSYPLQYTPDQENDDDHRLDLSIGQENAGGGNRGKRAKLGKLVIHDEGFKMLDLVVAANIGVWWSVWEFSD